MQKLYELFSLKVCCAFIAGVFLTLVLFIALELDPHKFVLSQTPIYTPNFFNLNFTKKLSKSDKNKSNILDSSSEPIIPLFKGKSTIIYDDTINYTNNTYPELEWIHEIIPQSLYKKYETFIPSNINKAEPAFPVSEPMMRRSRPLVGNTQRLHSVLSQLIKGYCINILVSRT